MRNLGIILFAVMMATGCASRQKSSSDRAAPPAQWEEEEPDVRLIDMRDELAPIALHKPQPIYPVKARRNNLQGNVLIGVVVGDTGAVESATLLKGDPIFADPGLQAVRRWRWGLLLVNGEPIRWKCKITLKFRLEGDAPSEPVKTLAATPRRIHGPPPPYPLEARARGLTGSVVADIRVDATGQVIAVKILKGDPVFAEPTRTTLLTWRYEPGLIDGTPTGWSASVTLEFAVPPAPADGEAQVPWPTPPMQ